MSIRGLQNQDAIEQRIFQQPMQIAEYVTGLLKIKLAPWKHEINLSINIEEHESQILAFANITKHRTTPRL
jgi:hypothetical protein